MGVLSGVTGESIRGTISGLGEAIRNIGDEFNFSGEEKAQFNVAVNQAVERYGSQIEETHRMEMDAKKEVIVAELNQGDNYTKRARPTVIYFGLLAIAVNYMLIPAIVIGFGLWNTGIDALYVTAADGSVTVKPLVQLTLPPDFWWAWGGITGTYVVGRTAEKYGVRNKITSAITGARYT